MKPISKQIIEYESLTHQERKRLLANLQPYMAEETTLSPEKAIQFYCLYTVAIGCCTTCQEIDEIENILESNSPHQFIRNAENRIHFPDTERQTLIDWCEKRLTTIVYWGRNKTYSFERILAETLNFCRYTLVEGLLTYSTEQLQALEKVNALMIETGRQTFAKVKSYENRLEEWNKGFTYTDVNVFLETAFTHHKGSDYEHWLSKQFSDETYCIKWGTMGRDDYEAPEEYIWLQNPKLFPDSDFMHWDEGTDREKVKHIPLCFIYHDLWDHMTITYSIPDILRVKEIKTNIEVIFEEKEGEDIWND